jgi:Ca2+-binding RTX toxin-like protein
VRRALLLAIAAWAVLPASASAHALMSAANGTLRLTDGDTISRNTVTVTPAAGGQARIIDATADGGLGPGSAFDLCVPITARELLCDVRKIRAIRIDVGSDDDRVSYRHPLPARLFGGGGHDELRGGPGKDVVDGGDGPDRVEGGAGDDAVGGGSGADEVLGDAGDDVLQGGLGVDALLGGDGDDELRARDGNADRVECGGGADRVAADDADPAVGCETIERAAPAADGSDLRLPGAGDAREERFSVRAVAAVRQPLRRGRLVLAVTSTRAARLRATGTVTVGGRQLRLRPAAGRVRVAGGGIELRLRLPAAALRARRATARVTVTARQDGGGRARSVVGRVMLTR